MLLFLFFRVAPTERIKLSVSKVTQDQYDRMYSDIYELRRAGIVQNTCIIIRNLSPSIYTSLSLFLPSLSLSLRI